MAEVVLVTGGTGFVAGWCIVDLLERGYAVRTTVRDLASEAAVRQAIASATSAGSRLTLVQADLTKDDGWDEAVAGCDYVLHVASPLGRETPRDRHALVDPAREGTLRVLRAATKNGVKRVVFTSAAAAARPPRSSAVVSDETVWADPDDPRFDAYRVSKILAERAAWDFMAEHAARTELTTILPGAVFGPLLRHDNLGSVQVDSAPARWAARRPPALRVLDCRRARSRRPARARDDLARGGGAAVHRCRRLHVDGGDCGDAEVAARRSRRQGADSPSAGPRRSLPRVVHAAAADAHA